jgi:hypothetical protein
VPMGASILARFSEGHINTAGVLPGGERLPPSIRMGIAQTQRELLSNY